MKTNNELCAEYRENVERMRQHIEELTQERDVCDSPEIKRKLGRRINSISAAIADSTFAICEMQPRKRGGYG